MPFLTLGHFMKYLTAQIIAHQPKKFQITNLDLNTQMMNIHVLGG